MAEIAAEDAVPTAGTNVEPKKRKKCDPGQHKCWWTGYCAVAMLTTLLRLLVGGGSGVNLQHPQCPSDPASIVHGVKAWPWPLNEMPIGRCASSGLIDPAAALDSAPPRPAPCDEAHPRFFSRSQGRATRTRQTACSRRCPSSCGASTGAGTASTTTRVPAGRAPSTSSRTAAMRTLYRGGCASWTFRRARSMRSRLAALTTR
eukprot:5674779-Prymnesium_polylepis.1